MRTAAATVDTVAGAVHIGPRRPSYWSAPSVHLSPWLPSAPWTAQLDPVRFARELAAYLNTRSAPRFWAEVHALVDPIEPVLVNHGPRGLAVLHRRLVAEWLARELGEEVPEPGVPIVDVQLGGVDPWAMAA